MNQLENKEIEISSNSSLQEIIAKKQAIKSKSAKPKSTNPTYKFYLSSKNNKFKLTNSKQKIVKEFDTFFEAISAYIEKGESLWEDEIPSRIWLYDKGSFRATLTLNTLKDLVADNTINANSNNLEISEERLNELLAKEAELENANIQATSITTEEVKVETETVAEDDFTNEVKNAVLEYNKLKPYKKWYNIVLYTTWIYLSMLLLTVIAVIIKGVL